jgi:hypothetical protein
MLYSVVAESKIANPIYSTPPIVVFEYYASQIHTTILYIEQSSVDKCLGGADKKKRRNRKEEKRALDKTDHVAKRK